MVDKGGLNINKNMIEKVNNERICNTFFEYLGFLLPFYKNEVIQNINERRTMSEKQIFLLQIQNRKDLMEKGFIFNYNHDDGKSVEKKKETKEKKRKLRSPIKKINQLEERYYNLIQKGKYKSYSKVAKGDEKKKVVKSENVKKNEVGKDKKEGITKKNKIKSIYHILYFSII
jgi:hypothetical protein